MVDEYLLRNLKIDYPRLYKDADEIIEYGPFELLILREGERPVVYDGHNKYCRELPRDPQHMSEKEYREEFGIRMRKRMQVKSYTQQILAEETGLGVVTINKYANGSSTPSLYNASRIAQALDCSIEDLMYTGINKEKEK